MRRNGTFSHRRNIQQANRGMDFFLTQQDQPLTSTDQNWMMMIAKVFFQDARLYSDTRSTN